MIVYRFVLCDVFTNMEFMGTTLDEPNPQIDKEFWDTFMQGGCFLEYRGELEEDEND